MKNPVDHYWRLRLDSTRKALEANHFQVFFAEDPDEARKLVLAQVVAAEKPASISWGGSMTFTGSGLYDALKSRSDMDVIDTFEKDLPGQEQLERRRSALLADLFITGTNAVTESGQLVNLDMYGNRVGALAFGPKSVVILAGRNKIAADLEAAMLRIKDFAAPANAMRLDKDTPCAKTAQCQECGSPDRICNVWTITEKSFPKNRIKVVLINADMGL